MKLLIVVLSLLSVSIVKPSNASLIGASGTSPRGPLSTVIDSLLSSLFFPGFSTPRSSAPEPIPQVVYLNAYRASNEPHSDSPNLLQLVSPPSVPTPQAQDNSEVIDTNEEPITVDRFLIGIPSRLQNIMPNVTGKFGNLLAKPQRLFGSGSSRNAAFDDINELSRHSGGMDNKIKRLVGTQISAFFGMIRDTIRERLQSLKSSISFKRQGASSYRSNEVTELENEATALDILYQFFQSPQALLQLLPQLLGQAAADSRRAFGGFDSSPYRETHHFEASNKTWTKGGSGIPGSRLSFLDGLTSFMRPSAAGAATGSRSKFGLLPFPTATTTTTTTTAPVNVSKGTRFINRLMSKTGLRGSADGATAGAAGSRLGSGLLPVSITATATATTAPPVNESKGTSLMNRLLSKTGLRGSADGATAGAAGSRLKFGFLPVLTAATTTTTTTTAAPVNESKGTRLINRLLSKTGLRGNASGAAAGGSRMKKEVDYSGERSVDEQKIGEDQTQ